MSPRRLTSRVATSLLVALVLTASLVGCALGGGGSLRAWADDEFERVETPRSTTTSEGSATTDGGSTTTTDGSAPPSDSTARYTTSESVSAVVNKFTEYSKPLDREERSGRTFLRYRDEIVAIYRSGSTTVIEIDGSRTGRQRHFFFIGGLWGSPSSYTDTIRGGGPGSGK